MKKISPVIIIIFLSLTWSLKAQPAQVPKTNPTKVYMHYMPWFDGPENPVAGGNYSWGWHWTMNNKNPNIIENGKRQIASHYYPLIGPYASKDPHVVEYHLLLMKLSGIDGVLVDWYGSEGSNGDVGSLLTNSNALIDRTDEVGIKFGLIMEDRFWGSIQNGRNSLSYARNNYFNRSHFIRHGAGNDPLVGIFGPITYQSPSQWSDILSYAGEDVEFLPLWYESGDAGASADGEYAWIYSDYLTGLRNFYANRAPGLKTAMGVAYPGFNDYYVQGGAGSSYFHIPENNGATLNETLATYDQYKGNLDFLQLATWNDFGEGTIFEPTLENGFKFLVRIQQYTGVPYTENDLKQVHRLFTLRKKYLTDGTKQSQLNTAFNHFVALRINDAIATMNSVDGGTTPPPPPAAIAIPGTLQAESYSGMNGIQTEGTSDAGGGTNVGWIDGNDWMDYNVNVSTSGTYNVSFRVASGTSGGQLQLRRGTSTLATITVPGTGGWQNWTTITTTANLTAGAQTLRLFAVSGGYNVNWVQFATGSTPPPPTGATSYFIKNRWQNNYLLDDNGQVKYGAATSTDNRYKWQLVIYNGHTRIKNVASGRFMNIENRLSYVEASSIPETYYSGYWVIEDYDGHKRIRNEWQNTYIHEENRTGFAQCSAVAAGAWSSHWTLINSSTALRFSDAEISDQVKVTVFPNPAVSSLRIEIKESKKYKTASLTDAHGKVVISNNIQGLFHEMDLSNIPDGLYILKLEGNSTFEQIKVFKK